MRYSTLLKLPILLLFTLVLFSCEKESIPTVPILTTVEPTSITGLTALSGGNITSEGGETVNTRGVCWSTKINPTVSDSIAVDQNGGIGIFESKISNLKPGTIYHIRAYATNSVGTAYGNDISFTTNTVSPTLSTRSITSITITSATSGIVIASNGGTPITNKGICWSTKQNPTINDSLTTNGDSILTKLLPNTTYYARAYAANSVGIAYGNELSFTTIDGVLDVEGNAYHVVTLGSQVWMSENLRTTKYRNGDDIETTIPYNLDTYTEEMPKYQWKYDGDDVWLKIDSTARYYTWFAITDSRNVCPIGWHIPTDEEWTTLENYLIANGYNYDNTTSGNKIAKAMASTYGWFHCDDCTISVSQENNRSGFNGLPLGYRSKWNGHTGIDFEASNAFWWSSSEMSTTDARVRELNDTFSELLSTKRSKKDGLSVRCVKD